MMPSGSTPEPAVLRLLNEVAAWLNSYEHELDAITLRRYIRELEASLRDAPPELHGSIHSEIGSCRMKLGQLALALAAHKKAATFEPSAAHENNVAYDLLLLARPSEALTHLRRGRTMRNLDRPVEVRLCVNEVDAHLQLGDRAQAERAFEIAVRRVQPGDTMNLLNLATLAASLGRENDCSEMFVRFAEAAGLVTRSEGQSSIDLIRTPQGMAALARMEQEVRDLVHRVLRRWDADPVEAALEAAPIDDEPLTREDEVRIAEGRASISRGETVGTDQLLRDLNLEPHR